MRVPSEAGQQHNPADVLQAANGIPMSRRTVAFKGIPAVLGLFTAACSGQTPPQPPRSQRELGAPVPPPTKREPTATPFQEGEIDSAHLNAILETLKSTGDPLLMMVSDQICILRSSPQLPAEFPSWISKSSKPARIVVTEGTESQAMFVAPFNKDPQSIFLMKTGTNNPWQQQPIETLELKGISLAIPDYVREGGLIEEGMYLAKEHLTNMAHIRMSQEFFGVGQGQGSFFEARELDTTPVTKPERKEIIGATAFSIYADAGKNEVWNTMDATPTFMLATRIDSLEQRGILTPERNKLPAFRLARDTFLRPNVGINVQMSQFVNEWIQAGTFLPPSGFAKKVFTYPIVKISGEYQVAPLPNYRKRR